MTSPIGSHGAANPALAQLIATSQQENIPCPVLHTLVQEGELQVDDDGLVSLDNLRQALKGIGLSTVAREVLVRGAKTEEGKRRERAGEMLTGSKAETLAIYKLESTGIMHTGDLKIRRGGFSQERLDWLLSHSSDGDSLTLRDLAAAQEAAVAADPGFRGHVVGMAELSALIHVFGQKNADGDKSLGKADLTGLFREGTFPEDFAPKKTGMFKVLAGMAGIAFHQLFTVTGRSAAGLDKAIGRRSPLDQSSVTGLGKAICPLGMQPAGAGRTESQMAHEGA